MTLPPQVRSRVTPAAASAMSTAAVAVAGGGRSSIRAGSAEVLSA